LKPLLPLLTCGHRKYRRSIILSLPHLRARHSCFGDSSVVARKLNFRNSPPHLFHLPDRTQQSSLSLASSYSYHDKQHRIADRQIGDIEKLQPREQTVGNGKLGSVCWFDRQRFELPECSETAAFISAPPASQFTQPTLLFNRHLCNSPPDTSTTSSSFLLNLPNLHLSPVAPPAGQVTIN
jgi:hypothetical protein